MKVLQMHVPSLQKKSGIQAVLFDLDGTLVDTAPDLAGALNHCLVTDGHAPIAVSQVRGLVGRGAEALLKRGYTLQEGAPPNPARLKDLRQRFLDYYGDHIADDSAPFEGVEDLLSTLQSSGIAMGVCTNKPHEMALTLIEHLGWTSKFGSIIGGDFLGVKKPDPAHIFAVAKALDVAPEACVFVGDSEVDYEAARAAEMRTILVRFGYSNIPFEEMPHAVLIDHYSEFLGVLEEL